MGMLGPNGAGKSTTMKILAGYLSADRGEVIVCGMNIRDDALKIKRILGYLPENNPLYSGMYVREYLAFVCMLHGLSRTKTVLDEMIEMVGLQPVVHKKIDQLSKGYRQRVGLAQAMMHNPEVLILDEPTSGLDPNQIVEIRSLIARIGEEKTVILSTHIMQEVQAVCHDVLILNQGRVIVQDELGMLEQQMENKYVKVEFEQPMDMSVLKELKGVSKISKIGDAGCEIFYQKSADIRGNIFDMAVKQGNRIIEMTPGRKSMEEIFKELTT